MPSNASRERWLEGRPFRGARWVAVVLSQLVQVPLIGWVIVSLPVGWPLVAAILAFVSSYLLLLVGRWPGPVLVAVAALTAPAILGFTVGPPVAAVPLAFAVVAATVRGARIWAWGTVAVASIVAIAVSILSVRGPSVRVVILLLVLCLLIGVGEAIRNRRARIASYRADLERRRRTEAERERLRIARELHDVLAHSLSSINVQAAVGLHLIEDDPHQAAEALANIKETSKSALDEVRGVLGFLRSGMDADETAPLRPDPQLSRLPALVDSLRSPGLAITLDDELPGSTPPIVQRTAYRIVQEALTNVARHSSAHTARVELAAIDGHAVVTIADDGSGASGVAVREGRGIVGMRERVALLGGQITVGPAPDGGFRVAAELPLEGDR
ncbi:sensor histidine kinase [Glaciibacter flavus]|uniref:histidine kinase n=1 Tax=Orlajensenia flava TaxID=2565934 RepID=A0A4S4FXX4_9MICO|nr:sensor histidine kinase [Glaciibacter flavus]THG35151.1 sensor histidine kinase [Glaciibacter flavus]